MAEGQMMTQKWQIAFKLLDFNKDGVLSVADKDACKEAFKAIFKPDEAQAGNMMQELDAFWKKSLFLDGPEDWSRSLNLDDFISSRRALFSSDRAAIHGIVKQATTHLVIASDVTRKGKFNYDEFKNLHMAAGQTDKKFIKTMYDTIESDADGNVPAEKIEEFYTELTMGSDQEKHDRYLSAFAAAGFV
ncbi:uncharacterized protein LOC128246566 isoform X2 [Mya arenaria]|uniref:uncharacterized protein LOC128246566 isoform X2 n=1 Tax=Mya arenaria TaxID=6604 RepID=UPI0022E32004|nr:uncharacterized protein LOC128246566 isoform X2 [Mya arenaria]XP_052820803.1 uncharacterized protein LOC128246566 isoform X2 [Mya arenaria]XP_052820812.1 uncharacterized protein LOC128246566 isoform X2 [Mya arenaria]